VAVVLAAALGYFFVIRPGQVQAKIEKEWSTPEAAAARRDGRTRDQAKDQLVQQLRAKEGYGPSTGHTRRRDRE
jgi:hypothetical protein